MDSPEILLWGGMWDLVTSVFVRTTSFQAPVLGGGIGGVNKMVETSLAVATIVFCYLTLGLCFPHLYSMESMSRVFLIKCDSL